MSPALFDVRDNSRLESRIFCCCATMVTDVHLAILSNALGIVLFLLVVLYHYINANYSRQ
ncbi:hypothetical protein NQ318_012993 [Aromia moschata]|uniref:Dolichyl-diphosphooligosaccharide--protein glycosyltransferase subunit 4 n=1 Tax=Aromia moschata TaxID=1265417 RepID=A0AAV8Y092_9CUCU|nr:hypothetical protein NQ318_012993 [Aromia moschata]